MKKIQLVIRIIASLFLVGLIWYRVDWSVGLFAGFMLFFVESQNLLNDKFFKNYDKVWLDTIHDGMEIQQKADEYGKSLKNNS